MEKLDKVIAGMEACRGVGEDCKRCPYVGEAEKCSDVLGADILAVLKECRSDIKTQDEVILELNRDLKRCRMALNAQGEYMYLGGDLISREALIERLENIDWYDGNGSPGAADEESAYIRYADVARVVAEALAVEVAK